MPKSSEKLEAMIVAAGQKWSYRNLYKVKVMGVLDGYVMFRRKGCYPSLMYFKDFEKISTQIVVAATRKPHAAVVE